jgi:S1-C subfamily serine protease
MNTRHWLIALAIVVGIFALLTRVRGAAASEEGWSLERMAEQIDATNVVVGVAGDGFCSGTLISRKHRIVLTASHCVEKRITRVPRDFVDPVTGEVTRRTIEKKFDLEVWQNVTRDYQVVSSRRYLARIAGNDIDNDVAILQILDQDFSAVMEVPLAPGSYRLMRGETIYVVGNPGVVLDNSVTKGIVSSTERTLDIEGKQIKVFQIDAASIGGNSGGSVLNDRGELVGSLDAGIRGSGINFAVPVSATKALLRRSGFPDVAGAAPPNVAPPVHRPERDAGSPARPFADDFGDREQGQCAVGPGAR